MPAMLSSEDDPDIDVKRVESAKLAWGGATQQQELQPAAPTEATPAQSVKVGWWDTW